MPLVFYDCACTLKRFMASKKRRRMSKVARTLSRLRLVIDKFHFRKGHSGCKPDGTRPFPKTWPQTHASSFRNINDSAAEQSFAFVRKIAVAARRMTPVRGLLFLQLNNLLRLFAKLRRSTGHSAGQPVNRPGQPGNRATGQPGRGVNRDPVSRLPGPEEKLKKLSAAGDSLVVCVCRRGNDSLTATLLLREAGIIALNLQGGLQQLMAVSPDSSWAPVPALT
eukprot:s989_g10.t1